MLNFFKNLYNKAVAWCNAPSRREIIGKATLAVVTLFFASQAAFAAGNGLSGINEATSMVTSYFDPGTKLIYAIGAVVGLIGVSRSIPSGRAVIPIPLRLPPRGSGPASSSS